MATSGLRCVHNNGRRDSVSEADNFRGFTFFSESAACHGVGLWLWDVGYHIEDRCGEQELMASEPRFDEQVNR
jgi:hypothetical protein